MRFKIKNFKRRVSRHRQILQRVITIKPSEHGNEESVQCPARPSRFCNINTIRTEIDSAHVVIGVEQLEPRLLLAADLIPYQPSAGEISGADPAWDSAIVVSTTPGTRTNATAITTSDSIYLDFAWKNVGTSPSGAFDIRVLLNGSPILSGTVSSLSAGGFLFISDQSIGALSAGANVFSLVVDPPTGSLPNGKVAESDETNNQFTSIVFNVQGTGSEKADLTTTFFPGGWDGPIVISNESGNTTDKFPVLSSADHIYVDFSVYNSGNASTGMFSTQFRLLDANNSVVFEQTQVRESPLGESNFATFEDVDFGMLAAGTYTIEMTMDVNGDVMELSESNNVVTRTFAVLDPGTISGIKWNDANGDGAIDPGENGIEDVTVYLDLNNNGELDAEEPTQQTASDGSYSFTVAPGTYFVAEVLDPGVEQTFPGPEGGLDTGFDIDFRFVDSSLTGAQQTIILAAAARWEEVIVGDLPDFYTDVHLDQPVSLSIDSIAGLYVDDLLIDAFADSIDGSGNTLGQGGPNSGSGLDRQDSSMLPTRGFLQIDSDDLGSMTDTQLFNVALHEIGHVLGMGTLFDDFGLVDSSNPSDVRYTGELATAEYNALFHNSTPQSSVPLENDNGHWRESLFSTELMTPIVNSGTTPLSRVTIAALADMGYEVDVNAADNYVPISAHPVASITAIDAIATEGVGDPGQFRIERTNSSGTPITSGSLTVTYTINGSATNGTDYTLLTNTVNISNGQSFATVEITPGDDGETEGTEQVTLAINSSTGAYTVGSPNAATVAIIDTQLPDFSTPMPHRVTVQPNGSATNVNFGNRSPHLTITHLAVSSSNWNSSFIDALDTFDDNDDDAYTLPTGSIAQLAPMSWSNIDLASITFSDDVNVTQDDLSVFGVNVADHTGDISGFNYDNTTFTATWSFDSSLSIDKLLLVLSDNVTAVASGVALDGEWEDSVSTESGDGIAGGDFHFRLNVLPGDANQSQLVAADDALAVIDRIISFPGFGDYNLFSDVNGDGLVAGDDALLVIDQIISFLPIAEPLPGTGQGRLQGIVAPIGNDPSTSNGFSTDVPAPQQTASTYLSLPAIEDSSKLTSDNDDYVQLFSTSPMAWSHKVQFDDDMDHEDLSPFWQSVLTFEDPVIES